MTREQLVTRLQFLLDHTPEPEDPAPFETPVFLSPHDTLTHIRDGQLICISRVRVKEILNLLKE
jgi:hypothetical protein